MAAKYATKRGDNAIPSGNIDAIGSIISFWFDVLRRRMGAHTLQWQQPKGCVVEDWAMATATGETIETPTQQMPFKAIIKVDGKVVTEEFFPTRAASEEFILGAIQRPEELTRKGGKLR